MTLDDLFNKLWQQYTHENPEALAIHTLFVREGEQPVNDHIAFRTFDDPRVNVDQLAKFFEALGYVACGEYTFPVKKLFAKHYEHKRDPSQPKIFISELKTKAFSAAVQAQAKKCIDALDPTLLNSPALLYAGTPWQPLDYAVYQALLAESEYAAWMYVFGFRANHFTVAVNELQHFKSIEAINALLKQNTFELNASGGEIKGTPSELLEQSSTRANKVSVKFKQGTFEVLNSYYEFARRYPDAEGKVYQGFIAASADKIFESTDINLKGKL